MYDCSEDDVDVTNVIRQSTKSPCGETPAVIGPAQRSKPLRIISSGEVKKICQISYFITHNIERGIFRFGKCVHALNREERGGGGVPNLTGEFGVAE